MNALGVITIAERGLAILDAIAGMTPELKEAAGDKLDLIAGIEEALAQHRAALETLQKAGRENRDVTGAELDASEEAARAALDKLKAAINDP